MATMFILIVFAYFVIVSDVGVAEKLVLAMLCAIAAVLPMFVASTAIPAAIAHGLLGVYVCLRMTYLRAQK